MTNISKLAKILAKERLLVRSDILPKNIELGRRLFVHLIFAHCEVLANYIKVRVNVDYDEKDWEGRIDTVDWLASMSDEYVLNDDGTFRVREKRTKALPNLLFAFRFCAKYCGRSYDPKKIAGWAHVEPAFKIRNRVTHPSMPAEMNISDAEMAHIDGLEQWLVISLEQAMGDGLS